LPDGRILSWSHDYTLRLWDRAGKLLNVLVGHRFDVKGALTLPDGRILSWSFEKNLRLWDRDGEALAVLEGHTDWVKGALALPDGRILSWSSDWTLRIWDNDGKPLEVYELDEGRQLYSEAEKAFHFNNNCVYRNTYLNYSRNSAAILTGGHRLATVWHGASKCRAHLLQPDGRVVVTQRNGQVCVLQLYHGHRPITLDDLEAPAPAA
jgi:WD40 repeat protein